jgi:hypothetical protein
MMKQMRGRRGRDRMAVGFIATYAISYLLLLQGIYIALI